jgi:hypothetical protein
MSMLVLHFDSYIHTTKNDQLEIISFDSDVKWRLSQVPTAKKSALTPEWSEVRHKSSRYGAFPTIHSIICSCNFQFINCAIPQRNRNHLILTSRAVEDERENDGVAGVAEHSCSSQTVYGAEEFCHVLVRVTDETCMLDVYIIRNNNCNGTIWFAFLLAGRNIFWKSRSLCVANGKIWLGCFEF